MFGVVDTKFLIRRKGSNYGHEHAEKFVLFSQRKNLRSI